MTFMWNLEYSGSYVTGLEADAFLHSFRSVESEESFQEIFGNAVTRSWTAFPHSLSSFFIALGHRFFQTHIV